MDEQEWEPRYEDEQWFWDDPDLGQACIATCADPLDRAPVVIMVAGGLGGGMVEAYLSVDAAKKFAAAVKDAAMRAWLRAHPAPPPSPGQLTPGGDPNAD